MQSSTDEVPTNGPGTALRIGLVAVVTLVAFESLAVITILPDVEADLGGLAWYGWVTTAFFLGTMLGIVFAGDQADRSGAGRPYLVGLILFAVGLLIGGLAPSMPVLVVGRFVQGFGAGVVPAIGYIVIGRKFAPEDRPRMFAILSTAWIVPGVIGPVLAERVAHGFGWRWVFLGLLPLVLAAGFVVLPPIFAIGPAEPTPNAPGPDGGEPVGRQRLALAACVAAGAALLLAALDARAVLVPIGVVGGLVIAVPALRRLVPRGTLSARPGMPAVVASRGLLTFSFLGADTFIPYAVTNARGHSTFAGSVAVTVTTLAWTSGTWLQQRRIAVVGERRYIRIGFVLLVPAVLIVAVAALPDAVPFWVIHLGWGLAGLGMGLAYSAHAQQLLRLAPAGTYGTATSSMQLCDNLGVALGTGLIGAALNAGVDRGWTPGRSVAVAFLLAAVAAALGVLVSRRLDGGNATAAVTTAGDHDPTLTAVH